jgi:putative colanic acid biosysnthesis UDP-glucose lipid carrier transferase
VTFQDRAVSQTALDFVGAERQARVRDCGAWKRTIDLSLAIPALLLFAPFMVAIALWIALDSRGPVLFRQHRLGMGGRPFQILKFRTMTVLEDGEIVTQARKNDVRVTRAGRFLRQTSLDELPQLINVIKSDMSLVGPRPHAIAHDKYFAPLITNYELRQQVKPGITGWAQVNGFRGETPTTQVMRQRVMLDLWYAHHWHPLLDLKILLRTARMVLSQRNAY